MLFMYCERFRVIIAFGFPFYKTSYGADLISGAAVHLSMKGLVGNGELEKSIEATRGF